MGRSAGPNAALAAFVLFELVSVRDPAQAQQTRADAEHRKFRKTIQIFFLVGPGLSTAIACRVTERQPGGNCRAGEALPQLAKEGSP